MTLQQGHCSYSKCTDQEKIFIRNDLRRAALDTIFALIFVKPFTVLRIYFVEILDVLNGTSL